MKLPPSFYLRDDVVQIAKDLLGKALYTKDASGRVTGGLIVETEGYAGAEDRASHAFDNRRTARTEVLFREGGIAYVYLCYGMHHLVNVVTNAAGTPHAVLIRALLPTTGIDHMHERRHIPRKTENLGIGQGGSTIFLSCTRDSVREHGPSAGRKKRGKADTVQNQVFSYPGYTHTLAHLSFGPGNVCTALGITKTFNGMSLQGDRIWIEDVGIALKGEEISAGPRVGVAYAGDDALLPWRFWLATPVLSRLRLESVHA